MLFNDKVYANGLTNSEHVAVVWNGLEGRSFCRYFTSVASTAAQSEVSQSDLRLVRSVYLKIIENISFKYRPAITR